MYKDQIIQIANIVSSHYQYVNTPGLLHGTLGIALFYYHYARFMSMALLEDTANELLKISMDEMKKTISKSFADGIYGFGWCLKKLIDNKYIEEDMDVLALFHTLSHQTYTEKDLYFEQMINPTLCSKSIIDSITPDENSMKRLKKQLDSLLISKIEIHKMPFWISLAYCLAKHTVISDKSQDFMNCEKIIEERLNICLQNGNYTSHDIYALNSIKNNTKLFENVNLKSLKINFSILNDMYMNWQTIIYDDVIRIEDEISAKEINNYLNALKLNTQSEDLSIDGICGLGINLIRKSKVLT